MSEKNKCAHASCACPAMEDSEYCSQSCSDAKAGDVVEAGCKCGHPGCE